METVAVAVEGRSGEGDGGRDSAMAAAAARSWQRDQGRGRAILASALAVWVQERQWQGDRNRPCGSEIAILRQSDRISCSGSAVGAAAAEEETYWHWHWDRDTSIATPASRRRKRLCDPQLLTDVFSQLRVRRAVSSICTSHRRTFQKNSRSHSYTRIRDIWRTFAIKQSAIKHAELHNRLAPCPVCVGSIRHMQMMRDLSGRRRALMVQKNDLMVQKDDRSGRSSIKFVHTCNGEHKRRKAF